MLKKSLKIESKIYPKKVISDWIKAFKSEGFDVSFEKDNLIISWENEQEIEEIFLEFTNYLIYLNCDLWA